MVSAAEKWIAVSAPSIWTLDVTKDLFTKLNSINKKHCFNGCILIGDVLSIETPDLVVDAVLQGDITLDIPTYFSIGKLKLHDRIIEHLQRSDDIIVAENLFFLGRKGALKTSNGLRITVLGGIFRESEFQRATDSNFDEWITRLDHAELTSKDSGPCDILLTFSWPPNLARHSQLKTPALAAPSSWPFADVGQQAAPQYWISTAQEFYEREPYSSASNDLTGVRISRFVATAPFNSGSKWFYAFNIVPGGRHQMEQPQSMTGVTLNPFIVGTEELSDPNKLRFRSCLTDSYSQEYHPMYRRKRPRRQVQVSPDRCFFCLSNTDFEKHLVLSIGDESYLALPKGPLKDPSAPDHAVPRHILIVTISHIANLSALSDRAQHDAALSEMERFRDAAEEMYRSKKLHLVACELSRACGIHHHWQCFAMTEAQVNRFETAIEEHLRANGASNESGTGEQMPDGNDFCRIFLPDISRSKLSNGTKTEYAAAENDDTTDQAASKLQWRPIVRELLPDEEVDLQLFRRAMCSVYNAPDQLIWRQCLQQADEEEADAAAFKKAFAPYDFTSD